MKANEKSLMMIITLAVLLLSAVTLPSTAATPAAVLGIPAGYSAGAALSINTSGQIVGMFWSPSFGYTTAGLWLANGTPMALGALDDIPDENLDYTDSQPNAINTSGQVVGFSTAINPIGEERYNRATLWSYDADTSQVEKTDLGTYGSLAQSEALDINDKWQILCKSWTTNNDEIWYLQEEDGTRIPITMPDNTPIDADGWGFLANSGMLNAEGQVAGVVNKGYYDQAVLWSKTETGGEAITITPLDDHSMVTAINDNGVVVGNVSTDMGTLPFVYDSINGCQILSLPEIYPETTQVGGLAMSVNNAGQVIVMLVINDNVRMYSQLWIWDNAAGKWTYRLPLESIIPIGATVYQALGFINNAGQVTGIAMTTPDDENISFLWSAGTGLQTLAGLGNAMTVAFAINDSGVSIGAAELPSGSSVFATAWGLPMTLTNATASRGKKTISVKVDISNPTNTTLTNVIVQTSSLMDLYGIDQTVYDALMSKSISVGSIKAGSSKKITLQFSTDIPMPTVGQLKLNITSSLGTFERYALINVP
ncbi:MAG: hypothetical protein ACYC0V_16495 [Armatimonadota bacterium]